MGIRKLGGEKFDWGGVGGERDFLGNYKIINPQSCIFLATLGKYRVINPQNCIFLASLGIYTFRASLFSIHHNNNYREPPFPCTHAHGKQKKHGKQETNTKQPTRTSHFNNSKITLIYTQIKLLII